MSEAHTNIIKHVKEEDGAWCILENDEPIFTNIPSEKLAEQLEEFICLRDLNYLKKITILSKENYALKQLSEFSMNLLSDALNDKLSDLDNMFALKTMLKETCKMFEDIIPALEQMKENTKKQK